MILSTLVLIVISAAACVLYVRFFTDGASSLAQRLLRLPVVIWQLPQIIIALLVLLVLRLRGARLTVSSYNRKRLVRFSGFSSFGVSLGEYIILPVDCASTTVSHEYGHCIQSLIFGPLYLLVIGLPSLLCNNIWDRLFHRKWSNEARAWWYYNRYPEAWADELGGVARFREPSV
jgi:hypothetical protein